MGEYAWYGHERIKIGTCEDLYYLRADQATKVVARGGEDTDVLGYLDAFRFRFPFPDEDNVAPGQFENPDRSLRVDGVEPPKNFDHYSVQFTARPGYLLSIPCPEGPEALTNIRVSKNGWRGDVLLVQQRVWNGQLVAVCQCGGCGARYRLETFEDAEPVIVALRAQADRAQRDAEFAARRHGEAALDDPTARRLSTTADRIVEGYANPPSWISTKEHI